MSEEIKKEEVLAEKKAPVPPEQTVPKMREIVILTDGNLIELKKAEVNGKIELAAILQSMLNYINQPTK